LTKEQTHPAIGEGREAEIGSFTTATTSKHGGSESIPEYSGNLLVILQKCQIFCSRLPRGSGIFPIGWTKIPELSGSRCPICMFLSLLITFLPRYSGKWPPNRHPTGVEWQYSRMLFFSYSLQTCNGFLQAIILNIICKIPESCGRNAGILLILHSLWI